MVALAVPGWAVVVEELDDDAVVALALALVFDEESVAVADEAAEVEGVAGPGHHADAVLHRDGEFDAAVGDGPGEWLGALGVEGGKVGLVAGERRGSEFGEEGGESGGGRFGTVPSTGVGDDGVDEADALPALALELGARDLECAGVE